MRFSWKEYVTDYYSASTVSGGGTVLNKLVYQLNPGLYPLFQYLNTIANQFVNYRVYGCNVVFKSTTGVLASSSNLGQIVMRYVDDPTDAQDLSIQQIQNNSGSIVGNPSQSMILDCNGSGYTNQLKIRAGPVPSGQDPRMYDFGFVEIYSQGFPTADANLGQIHVTYDFEFIRPNYIQGSIGNTLRSLKYQGTGWANATPLYSMGAGLGVGLTIDPNNLFNVTDTGTGVYATGAITGGAADCIVFPSSIEQGTYKITMFWNSINVAVASYMIFPTNTQCKNCTVNGTDQMVSANGVGGETSSDYIMSFKITINAPGNSQASVVLASAGNVLPTQGGGGYWQMFIDQVNPLQS